MNTPKRTFPSAIEQPEILSQEEFERNVSSIRNTVKGKAAIASYATLLATLVEREAEIARLRGLLWTGVLCGGCGHRYKYNRADDPDGEIAGAKHSEETPKCQTNRIDRERGTKA